MDTEEEALFLRSQLSKLQLTARRSKQELAEAHSLIARLQEQNDLLSASLGAPSPKHASEGWWKEGSLDECTPWSSPIRASSAPSHHKHRDRDAYGHATLTVHRGGGHGRASPASPATSYQPTPAELDLIEYEVRQLQLELEAARSKLEHPAVRAGRVYDAEVAHHLRRAANSRRHGSPTRQSANHALAQILRRSYDRPYSPRYRSPTRYPPAPVSPRVRHTRPVSSSMRAGRGSGYKFDKKVELLHCGLPTILCQRNN